MKRHRVGIVIISILLSSAIAQASLVLQQQTDKTIEPSETHIIYVDDDNTQGPWNGSYSYPYQRISDGILHAIDNDMVFVFSGIYYETFLLNKTIDLHGEQQNSTIIDGQNAGPVITVASDDVDICGFTVRNSGGYQDDAGIIVDANSTTITDCTMYRARTGIYLQGTRDTVMTNCRFHTNGYGVFSKLSVFVTLDQCLFYHNGIGAYFSETSSLVITDSYADTNGIGFLCERSSSIRISESAARDNDDNEGGMIFEHCDDITVDNCYLVHNGVGLNLINSSEWYILLCNFSFNTHFACKIKDSASTLDVINNVFTENLRNGIQAENSTFNVSLNNIVMNQNYGLYATTSTIDATSNWWGSQHGPARTGITRGDRSNRSPLRISYFPWLRSALDGIGPDWDLDTTFKKPSYSNPWPEEITFPDLDTDNDNAPDWWEMKWGYDPSAWDDHQHLDPDQDALTNIEECFMDQSGSDPFHKDVFLELDWTTSLVESRTNDPGVQEVAQMIDAFARQNITLHVDTGDLGGGEEIPPQEYVSYAHIIDLYWEYFLHNDLNNVRQRIFHYGIICDYTEGPGFAVIGWDHLNSFIIGAQFLTESYPRYSREWLVMTSVMHELGHTFSLIVTKYNGIDNHLAMQPFYKEFWYYSRYVSLLNYLYTFWVMDYSDGSRGKGDYDDWGALDFSFFKNTEFRYSLP